METGPTVRERIEAAQRLLESRLDDDLSLDEVAREAHFSPFHFHRLFRGLTGETVRGFVRRLRLERAAHRLVQGEEEILGVALDAGYGSHEAFTRAFREHFGTAPSVFRTERREVIGRRVSPAEEKTMNVRIERRDAVHVASVRHVGPYDQVGQAWKSLMKWGWLKMLRRPDTFGLCHDDPEVTDAARLRYDACMVVPAGTRVRAPVELREIPGGDHAVALHEGPYERIGTTYAALFAHVAERAVAGVQWTLGDPPSIERYLTDPRRTPPEELRTEVWMPVRRTRG